jgi:predicted RNA-binding protein YlxR (DUF448 family)
VKSDGSRARIPERRCAGCGGRFPKTDLIRLVRGEDGRVAVDNRMRAQSRGTYVCKDPACLKKALKSGRLVSQIGATLDASSEEAVRRAVTGEETLSKD